MVEEGDGRAPDTRRGNPWLRGDGRMRGHFGINRTAGYGLFEREARMLYELGEWWKRVYRSFTPKTSASSPILLYALIKDTPPFPALSAMKLPSGSSSDCSMNNISARHPVTRPPVNWQLARVGTASRSKLGKIGFAPSQSC